MECKGSKILISSDYTNEVSQRRAFRDVMQILRDGGIKHTLRCLARLHIYWQDGKAPKVFDDLKEAMLFVERNKAREGE